MTAKTLRRARLRAGLTQLELAQLAGLTPVTIVRAEGGRWPISDLTWARLARALEEYEAGRAAARVGAPAETPPVLT